MLKVYMENEYSPATINAVLEKHNTELRLWKKQHGQANWPMDGAF